MSEEKLVIAKLCIEAVKNDGDNLKYVPDEFKTAQLCLAAMDYHGTALEYVPEKFKTAELCFKAVKCGCGALAFVPEERKTMEMCLEAIKQDKYYRDAPPVFKEVPKKFHTPELCLEAVKVNPHALEYIPNELKTHELCLEAVRKNGGVLEHVPDKLKTAELCKQAVEISAWALRHVPDEFKTMEMCLKAVREADVIQYVPDKFKTAELCRDAISQPDADLFISGGESKLQYIPDEFKTAKLCLGGVKTDAALLKIVPQKFKTRELYFEAAASRGFVFGELVKKAFDDREFLDTMNRLALKPPRNFDFKAASSMFEELPYDTQIDIALRIAAMDSVGLEDLGDLIRAGKGEAGPKHIENIDDLYIFFENVPEWRILEMLEEEAPAFAREIIGLIQHRGDSVMAKPKKRSYGGVQAISEILRRVDHDSEKRIIAALNATTPAHAGEIMKRMFTFDDIARMDDNSIYLPCEMDEVDIAKALNGAGPKLQDKVLRAFPKEKGNMIEHLLQTMGEIDADAIAEAREKIIGEIRHWAHRNWVEIYRTEEEDDGAK